MQLRRWQRGGSWALIWEKIRIRRYASLLGAASKVLPSGWLQQQTPILFTVPEVGSLRPRMSAGLGSSEASLLGLKMAVLPLSSNGSSLCVCLRPHLLF